MELFVTICNNFQQVAIVAISTFLIRFRWRFQDIVLRLDQTKTSIRWILCFMISYWDYIKTKHVSGGSSVFMISYWDYIKTKHVSGGSFVFISKQQDSIWYAYRIERLTIYIEFLLEEKNNKWKFFYPVISFTLSLTAIISDFQNTITAFFFRVFFFVFACYLQFSIFLLLFYFENLLFVNTTLDLKYYYCFSMIDEPVIFCNVAEFLVHFKNRVVFTLINQLMVY